MGAPLACALMIVAGSAAAAPAIGLVGDRTLVMIETETAALIGSIDLPGKGRLVGIDWRTADRNLYALTEAGEILRINFATHIAEPVLTAGQLLPMAEPVTMSFNPSIDRLRLVSGLSNRRIDVDTGEITIDAPLHFAPGADVGGATPNIVATAFSSGPGRQPAMAAQYGIDAGLGALVRQSRPSDGALYPVGLLGIAKAGRYAFDIAQDADGTPTAWLVADGILYTVSLEDGSVSKQQPLPGTAGRLRDLTILSDM